MDVKPEETPAKREFLNVHTLRHQLTAPTANCPRDTYNCHGSVDDMLDTENKRLAENLATKVSRLKSLAYDIDREADDQNEYLDGMDSNFLSATGLLSGSVKRFSTMVRSGRDNRRILCYVSVGLVLAFFLLYYMVSRIQR
ncbi:BET1-like protein isoform X1 [Centropristis striata]|uniref:BET1-like protein isoform X1 n=1 Tax=Centropristis striata TaxID=184440 RepID=UPI0027E0A7F8|nr:BET1-like protein isoform X1 [Centropristis striata]